jgi:hypothetical protein
MLKDLLQTDEDITTEALPPIINIVTEGILNHQTNLANIYGFLVSISSAASIRPEIVPLEEADALLSAVLVTVQEQQRRLMAIQEQTTVVGALIRENLGKATQLQTLVDATAPGRAN